MNAATLSLPVSSPDRLRPGDVLGTYRLLCPVARGGMGQIWAARRTGRLGLPKLVAIKTALPLPEQRPEFLEKLFFDEARVAASIDHPNVCRIYELGEAGSVLYLAMEWIDGASLFHLVSALDPPRRLDYRMAAYIVGQACAGLHAAHELRDDDGVLLGVVHRDATPQNLLISTAGDVKVVDFGVVKARDQAHQATVTGELKGKVSYLAPEQLRSKQVDRRADVFALGCVLYLITTGRRPFAAPSTGETLLNIVEDHYELPSAIVPDYPAELEAIVVRALAHHPDDRFSTADDMREALAAFSNQGAAPPGRDELAALLLHHLGDSIEQRRAELRAAQKVFELDSGRSVATSHVSGTFAVRVPAEAMPPRVTPSTAPTCIVSTAPTLVSTDQARAARRHPLRIQRAPVYLCATVLLGALAAGALGLTSVRDGAAANRAVPSIELPSSVAPAPRPSVAPPELVTISVQAVPSDATLTIDDGSAVPTPRTLVVPRDDRPHVFELRAPHRAGLARTVVFDRDQSLTLELGPERKGTAAGDKPGTRQSSRVGAQVDKTTADPFAAPLRAHRPRRPIDETDPFRE